MKSFFNKAGVKQLFLVSSVTFFRSAFLQQIKIHLKSETATVNSYYIHHFHLFYFNKSGTP